MGFEAVINHTLRRAGVTRPRKRRPLLEWGARSGRGGFVAKARRAGCRQRPCGGGRWVGRHPSWEVGASTVLVLLVPGASFLVLPSRVTLGEERRG